MSRSRPISLFFSLSPLLSTVITDSRAQWSCQASSSGIHHHHLLGAGVILLFYFLLLPSSSSLASSAFSSPFNSIPTWVSPSAPNSSMVHACPPLHLLSAPRSIDSLHVLHTFNTHHFYWTLLRYAMPMPWQHHTIRSSSMMLVAVLLCCCASVRSVDRPIRPPSSPFLLAPIAHDHIIGWLMCVYVSCSSFLPSCVVHLFICPVLSFSLLFFFLLCVF